VTPQLRGLFIRLVTGSSWVDIEAILDHQVSDTTLRARRDEWIDAGVFDTLKDEPLAAFDRIIGLELDDVAIDGSLHKAPYGGEGTGANPTDRGKCGWKWSVAADGHGIPIGWTTDGANRNDLRLLQPTLDAVEATGLHHDIAMLHLDRGLRLPQDPPGARRTRLHRARHPEARHQAPTRHPAPLDPRAALDRRGHELVVIQLRPAPPQHRPPHPTPPRRPLPRHRRPTHRPPQPLDTLRSTPIRSSPKPSAVVVEHLNATERSSRWRFLAER
jgi:hypothetical protein